MARSIAIPALAGTALIFALAVPLTASAESPLVASGRAIVSKHCARCHAIDKEGASSHKDAPPFRTLSQRYPIESLAEALAEGIVTGHPDMPEFVFEPPEISAILAYLESLGGRPYQ